MTLEEHLQASSVEVAQCLTSYNKSVAKLIDKEDGFCFKPITLYTSRN